MNKIFEQLLRVRGVTSDFLRPKYEELKAGKSLPDMDKAIKRLLEARKKQEKVLIYGDYDVDGITATAIMIEIMKLLGIEKVLRMLPDRFIDGYGMSERLVERAKKEQVDLVVTVDCGSNNAEIIEKLADVGIDVLVTDHHELNGEVPKKALAVVNPKRKEFGRETLEGQVEEIESKKGELKEVSGLKKLAGAGVTFMVAKELADRGEIKTGQEKWLLDLAMIGTICDSMELTGENRVICKYGTIVLGKTRRVGLKALMRIAGVKKLSAEAIGFQIGPRLNAAGRMETAELALELLLTDSKVEAERIADELNNLNQERRRQQQQAIKEVEQSGLGEAPVIVASGKWHEGIVGIIAGRLTERYKKPSFVLTEVDAVLKGSGRSFGEFNLAAALSKCQDLLISGGGHAAACGVKLEPANFEKFKERINQYYRELNLKNQERFLEIKADLSVLELQALDLELMEEMTELEPFGEGNPEPVFLLENMVVLDVSTMGADGQHLRMLVKGKDGKTMKLLAFFAPKSWLETEVGAEMNLWVSLMENEWQGTRSVEGRILKIEYAG